LIILGNLYKRENIFIIDWQFGLNQVSSSFK